MENAKLGVASLRELMADAVFLDEEAFTAAGTLQGYHNRILVRQVFEC